jgi:hypothetical protein
MTPSLSAVALALMLAPGIATPLAAPQEANKTQALAKQLTDLMQAQKLDAVATRTGEDQFAAVLFIPGVQMLVVSARYSAPPLLNEKIISRQYRDVYLDLASASILDSKLFIEDMQADGLHPDRVNDSPFDIVTKGSGASFPCDGDHKKKKISEEEYRRTYADFEGAYEKILVALLAQVRK